MATSDVASADAAQKLTFMGLPRETQKDIIAHCSQSDLVCISLVSKHFRDLAAAQLYRNFHIVFPDEDDHTFDSPFDGLAGGLDTFVTSDYNYGQHLRDLSLDTLSAGDTAEKAYKEYLYSVSCGKFMNTLLHLTLRKAQRLETFKWNIRVELSRPVYKTLHSIETLKNVHIRLQVGPSLHEALPPLPSSFPSSTSQPAWHAPTQTGLQPSTSQSLFGAPPPLLPPGQPPFYISSSTMQPVPAPSITSPKASPKAKSKRQPLTKEPPTLSGFKKLKSLAVLDMDTLDFVPEIKTCLKNSSSTLTKLELSFSDKLAAQARKPTPDAELDDSDQEDEFQPISGQSAAYGDSGLSLPARALKAAEERKGQEAVLAKIFDVEQHAPRKPTKRFSRDKPAGDDKAQSPEEVMHSAHQWLIALKTASTKFLKDLNLSTESDVQMNTVQQELFDTMGDAISKMLAALKEGSKPKPPCGASSSGEPSSAPPVTDVEAAVPATTGINSSGPSSVKAQATASNGSNPEDINIEEPEEQLAIDELDTPQSSADVESPAPESGSETPVANAVVEQEAKPDPASHKDKFGALVAEMQRVSGSSLDLSAILPKLDAPKDENLGALTAKLQLLDPSLDLQKPDATEEENVGAMFGKLQHASSLKKSDVIREKKMQKQKGDRDVLLEKIQSCFTRADYIRQEMNQLTAGDIRRVNEPRIREHQKMLEEFQMEIDMLQDELDAADKQAQDKMERRISEYVRATRGIGLESLSIHLIPVKASVLSKAIDLRALQTITLLNVGPQQPVWALLAKENKIKPLPLRKIFTDNVTPPLLTFVSQLEELHELFLLERNHKYKPESFASKTATTIEQIRKVVLKKHLPTLRKLMIKNMDKKDWDVDEQTVKLICRKGKLLEELAVSMNIASMHPFMRNISGLANLCALHIIQLRNDDTCVWVMRETKNFLIDNLSHHPKMKLEWVSIDDDDRLERIVRIPVEHKKKDKGKGKESASTPTAYAWDSNQDSGSDESSDEEEDEKRTRIKLESMDELHFYDVLGVKIFSKEVVTGRL